MEAGAGGEGWGGRRPGRLRMRVGEARAHPDRTAKHGTGDTMTISNEGSEKTQGTRAADALPPEPVTLRAADGYACAAMYGAIAAAVSCGR